MKTILKVILACVFFFVLLGLVLLKLFHKPAQQPIQQVTSFPTATSVNIQDQTSPEIKQEQRAFKNKIINTDEITLGRAKIIAPYAIQDWGDENKGGEALLKYDAESGWQIISMGGGAWDVDSLIQVGVPSDIAHQLMGA